MSSAIGFICRIVLFFLFLTSLAVGQSNSSFSGGHLTLLHSSDNKHFLTEKRLKECRDKLVSEWKLNKNDLPNILVFQVSKNAARAALVNEKVALRQNFSRKDGKGYFELWINDEANLRAVIVGLQTILESHFSLQIADDQRRTVMNRVFLLEEGTIDVSEGK